MLENSCIQFNAHITKYYMSEDACWLAHSDADYEGRTTGWFNCNFYSKYSCLKKKGWNFKNLFETSFYLVSFSFILIQAGFPVEPHVYLHTEHGPVKYVEAGSFRTFNFIWKAFIWRRWYLVIRSTITVIPIFLFSSIWYDCFIIIDLWAIWKRIAN